MKTLLHYFLESLEKHPDNNAFFCDGKYYTYREFYQLVSNIRKELQSREFDKEQFLGILTGHDIETYASIFAALFSGTAFVPINHQFPIARCIEIMSDAGITKVLVSRTHTQFENNRDLLNKEGVKLLDTSAVPQTEFNIDLPEIEAQSYAYMLFTSGSTGKPKGVLVRHQNLAQFVTIYFDEKYYKLSDRDRFLQVFDWTFDLAGMMTYVPLAMGACCYVLPEEGIKYYNIISMLMEHEITASVIVPSTLLYLKPYFDEVELPRMRYSMFCGEPLLHSLMLEWSQCLSKDAIIQNVYGPSECPGASSIFVWDKTTSGKQSVHGIVPIGKPVPEMEFFLLNESKEVVQPGEIGTIGLCSKQVTQNYWKDPVRTKQVYLTLPGGEQVYDTGDQAFMNEHGNYIYVGRIDHQLKLDGHRVEPGEIEHAVRSFVGDTQVALVAKQNEQGILVPHLFLEGYQDDIALLQVHLKEKLPPYMQPGKIHNLQKFPHNLNGKIDKKALMASL